MNNFCRRPLLTAVFMLAVAAGVPNADAMVGSLDLGPPASSGEAAVKGQPQRNLAIIHALACDDEMNFLAKFHKGLSDYADWPIAYLTAKSAFASGRYFPPTDGIHAPDCRATEFKREHTAWQRVIQPANFVGVEGGKFDGDEVWRTASNSGDTIGPSALAQAINQYYGARFGMPCNAVAKENAAGEIDFTLTPECMMRQIRIVLTAPELGAWGKRKDGSTEAKLPGTDKLPCINAWPFSPLAQTGGDWDMSVITFTRLAHLIYEAKSARADQLASDGDLALDKMNQWLLTLRGGPAEEVYNLFWSCGNPANSYGTADDYVAGNDVYAQGRDEAIGKDSDREPSFAKKAWRFLRFLLILAAVAFAVGAAIGLLAGGVSAAGSAALSIGAAIVGATILVIEIATVIIGGIEETENHLFMQNSSKYLKNKLMMAELRQNGNQPGFNLVSLENERVRIWLLKRMKRVVVEDFVEYNAKPYSAFSHQSILNLLDFSCDIGWNWDDIQFPTGNRKRACDPQDLAIRTAAAAIYDLSAAKLAVGSNEGRRVIPFRRLVHMNHLYYGAEPAKHMHELADGADHLLAALQVWTGWTQHGPEGRASATSVPAMIWYATSRYLPHALISDLAVDKSTPVEQTYVHHTQEFYSNGPRWSLTAGGDSTMAAQGLRINLFPFGWFNSDVTIHWLPFINLPKNDDKGAAVPTTLMVAGVEQSRDTVAEFLRFDGDKDEWGTDEGIPLISYSNNRCVDGNFACGLRLMIPPQVSKCLKPASHNPAAPPSLKFISSGDPDCQEYHGRFPDDDFFVAVYEGKCKAFCNYPNWGFIEVVEAKQFNGSIQLYEDMLIAGNRENIANWEASSGLGELKFFSVGRNRTYRFVPFDEDFDRDCRACGNVVHGDGSLFSIRNPRQEGKAIVIDVSDYTNPKRVSQGGLVLENP